MGIFGNILLFILAIPFLAACVNNTAAWFGMGAIMSGGFAAVFLHPALLTLSIAATIFGMIRIRLFIRRNDAAHREEELLEKLEDRKDRSGF